MVNNKNKINYIFNKSIFLNTRLLAIQKSIINQVNISITCTKIPKKNKINN